MSTEVERTVHSIYGTTEGPKTYQVNANERALIGGWGDTEYYVVASVEVKSDDSSEVTLFFRRETLMQDPTVKRADGSTEKIGENLREVRATLDLHLDPEIKVILSKGDQLAFSAPSPRYKALVRQK